MTAPKSNQPTLKSIADRINRLEDEKQEIADAIKEVYVEAKSHGFNTKALRKVIREQRKPPDAEVENLLDTYRHALGLLAETPLGQAALARVSTADAPFHAPADDDMKVAEPT